MEFRRKSKTYRWKIESLLNFFAFVDQREQFLSKKCHYNELRIFYTWILIEKRNHGDASEKYSLYKMILVSQYAFAKKCISTLENYHIHQKYDYDKEILFIKECYMERNSMKVSLENILFMRDFISFSLSISIEDKILLILQLNHQQKTWTPRKTLSLK